MKIQVIIGAVRPARSTDRVAKWVATEAKNIEDFEIEIVDLIDYPLPFMDEDISPRYNPNRTPNEGAQKWLAKLAEGDAYIFVSPEYNRAMPGVLKNAIDYIGHEMDRKPIMLVTHGVTGGSSASDNLRLSLRQLGGVITPDAVTVASSASAIFSEEGELSAEVAAQPYGPKVNLGGALTGLHWWTKVLNAGRQSA